MTRAYVAAASRSQGLTSSSEIVWRSRTSKAALSQVTKQSVPHGPEC